MLHRHLFIGRSWLSLFGFVVCAALLVACNTEHDPTNPKGAYYLYRDALLAGEEDTVWERLDERTHQYYEERYDQLVEMDENIETYLPQTDHKLARKQSGAELLDEVDSAEQLFAATFEPSDLPEEKAIEVGSDVEELTVSEDETEAKAVTRSGQEYLLSRDEESEEWHVMLSSSTDALDEAFGWLDKNREALRETVDDLMAEEREKREEIIAELMDKQDP